MTIYQQPPQHRQLVGRSVLDAYRAHAQKWRSCERCGYHQTCYFHVLFRGTVPSTVLFVGEAPGASEDVLARPFVGPAGRILDTIIERCTERFGSFSWSVTNLVACIPKDHNMEIDDPSIESIESCRPRLVEWIKLCRPRIVVSLGDFAHKYIKPALKLARLKHEPYRVECVHPAWIVRQPVIGTPINRCVCRITEALRQL